MNIVRMLLKPKTAERESEYVSGKIPCALILAVSAGHVEMVRELLLVKNARKHASMVDSHGRSALAIARALKYQVIVELLEPYSVE